MTDCCGSSRGHFFTFGELKDTPSALGSHSAECAHCSRNYFQEASDWLSKFNQSHRLMEVNKCFTLEEMLRAAHIHCWEEVSEATTTPDQLWRCKAALTDDDDDGSRTCDALIRRTIKPRPVHWQTLELLESGSVIVARPLEFSFSEKKTVNKKTLHDNKNYNPDNDHFNVYLLTERSPTAVHIACREFSGWITTPQLAKLKFVDFKTREPVSFSPIEPPAAAKLPL